MADKKSDGHGHGIVEYPSGLLENPGGKIPVFLKLTYIGFTIYAIIYFFMYLSGDGSPLVELYNKLTAGG